MASIAKPISRSGDGARFAPRPADRHQGRLGRPLLSDWLWVRAERALGDNLVFYPSPSTVGAVMVPANSTIRSVADLRGKKSRLRAAARQELAAAAGLARRSNLVCAARPASCMARRRSSGKAVQGEHDATLESGTSAPISKAGLHARIVIDEVMKRSASKGAVAILGFTFEGAWAAKTSRPSIVPRGPWAQQESGLHRIRVAAVAPRIGVSDPKGSRSYRHATVTGDRPALDRRGGSRARGALWRAVPRFGRSRARGPGRELDRAPSIGREDRTWH